MKMVKKSQAFQRVWCLSRKAADEQCKQSCDYYSDYQKKKKKTQKEIFQSDCQNSEKNSTIRIFLCPGLKSEIHKNCLSDL
jgi:hypothetical protein